MELIYKYYFHAVEHPSIAQLAERETVEAWQLSLGHWFESGWTEIFSLFFTHMSHQKLCENNDSLLFFLQEIVEVIKNVTDDCYKRLENNRG